MSRSKKLAHEIVMVMKYNPELKEDEKVLLIETRLDYLIRDVERGCEEAHKRVQDNAVIIDERPQDIPVLREAMLNQQQTRGPLN